MRRQESKAGALYEFEAGSRKASMARRGRERRGATRRLVADDNKGKYRARGSGFFICAQSRINCEKALFYRRKIVIAISRNNGPVKQ